MVAHLPLVEAAILYDRPFVEPPFALLLQKLNAKMQAFGASLVQTNASGEHFVTFRTEEMYALISFNPQPLGPEGFQGALGAAITQMSDIDYAARVKAHTANIFITVGDGKTHLTDTFQKMLDQFGVPHDAKPTDLRDKILLLHAAVLTVLEEVSPAPAAIHWCQSDTFHDPQRFPRLTRAMPFPITLVARPEFYHAGKDLDGRDRYSIVMAGSERFCDKTLVLDVTTRDQNLMLTTLEVLMLWHTMNAKPLMHGGRGGIDDISDFRVEHHPPTERFPAGAIAIVVEPKGAGKPDNDAPSNAKPACPAPGRAKSPEDWRFNIVMAVMIVFIALAAMKIY